MTTQTHSCDIRFENCVIYLSGNINRYSVVDLMHRVNVNEQCEEYFSIDLAGVEQVDTAGLAWLLKVMAQAKQSGQVVHLQAVPERLMALAAVSGVEALLTSA